MSRRSRQHRNLGMRQRSRRRRVLGYGFLEPGDVLGLSSSHEVRIVITNLPCAVDSNAAVATSETGAKDNMAKAKTIEYENI